MMSVSMPVFTALGLLSLTAGSALPASPDAATAAAADDVVLTEIHVIALEPRYAAPTTRDRIGRVWVPVHIDGSGPFRLVLDTGAQRSAILPKVAQLLGLPLDRSPPVRLHGITGTAIAPTVDIGYLTVGDLIIPSGRLTVVADAFGGAEGLLGVDGLQDRRIRIDFRADQVDITRSNNRRATSDFIAIPFLPDTRELLAVRAEVGGVVVRAIIDTGAQTTMGNEALRTALRRQLARAGLGVDEIQGATGDIQTGLGARVSPIRLGNLQVRDAHVTFGDLHIFDMWELSDTPALVIGMDILGLVDTLVIDYGRKELHIKPRRG
jgi:predicted aspartyl protease